MLIRNAELSGGQIADVRIAKGCVDEIGSNLRARTGEPDIDAKGAALIPGLVDHHIHLFALAAAMNSIPCGPPDVTNARALAQALRDAPGAGWIRGIGYHESIAGELDTAMLDNWVGDRPMRIQHRTGRCWFFNSKALALLDAERCALFERKNGRLTGRLYDADAWLAQALPSASPDLSAVSLKLAERGVTAVTDATVRNDRAMFEYLRANPISQTVQLMGDESLLGAKADTNLRVGPLKIHLHENELGDVEALAARIARSHAAGRAVAFHCVALAELVFALEALRLAGSFGGDRIEHGGVVPPDLIETIAALGLIVVTQPHFIAERGDTYLRDVAPDEQPWLYRARSLRDAGIFLAAGSDAPYGSFDPWRAMAAATARRTRSGAIIGASEALAPEDALALYLSPLDDPRKPSRTICVGAPADLCLLDRPWQAARAALDDVNVRLTLHAGTPIWDAAARKCSP